MAVREFGMMAPVVFRQWGVRTTDDFGRMVFRLIEADRLSKSDRDDPEDFHDLFDLEKALTEGFEMTLGDAAYHSAADVGQSYMGGYEGQTRWARQQILGNAGLGVSGAYSPYYNFNVA